MSVTSTPDLRDQITIPADTPAGTPADTPDAPPDSPDSFFAAPTADQRARERFGGIRWGAAVFGWLMTLTVALLASVVFGAVVSVVGSTAESEGRMIDASVGVAGAIGLTVVMLVAYLAGGYVAGRMCRYDGARQGTGVWAIGLAVGLVTAGAGVLLDREYDVIGRIDLPGASLSGDLSSLGAVLTVAMILAVTLIAAMCGGALGQRYHAKVDRARDA